MSTCKREFIGISGFVKGDVYEPFVLLLEDDFHGTRKLALISQRFPDFVLKLGINAMVPASMCASTRFSRVASRDSFKVLKKPTAMYSPCWFG
jgi:hypothetical protein